MFVRDLFYNASGAKDPTAHDAILNVEGNMTIAKRGEIWKTDSTQNTDILIVLGVSDRKYVQTTALFSTPGYRSDIEIEINGETYYADSGRLTFTYDNRLLEYVDTVSADKWAEISTIIHSSICECMDYDCECSEVIKPAEAVVHDTPDVEPDEELLQEIDRLREEALELKGENKVLNSMIDRLLSKM